MPEDFQTPDQPETANNENNREIALLKVLKQTIEYENHRRNDPNAYGTVITTIGAIYTGGAFLAHMPPFLCFMALLILALGVFCLLSTKSWKARHAELRQQLTGVMAQVTYGHTGPEQEARMSELLELLKKD